MSFTTQARNFIAIAGEWHKTFHDLLGQMAQNILGASDLPADKHLRLVREFRANLQTLREGIRLMREPIEAYDVRMEALEKALTKASSGSGSADA